MYLKYISVIIRPFLIISEKSLGEVVSHALVRLFCINKDVFNIILMVCCLILLWRSWNLKRISFSERSVLHCHYIKKSLRYGICLTLGKVILIWKCLQRYMLINWDISMAIVIFSPSYLKRWRNVIRLTFVDFGLENRNLRSKQKYFA